MEIYGHHFSQDLLDQIQETIRIEPSISRRELSQRICQWLGWRSPNGGFQDMSCRKALAELDRRGILDMTKPQRTFGFEQCTGKTIEPEIATINCTLAELGEIRVEPVSSRYCRDSKI